MALAQLAERSDKPLDGLGIFGVIKESGVDDVGLTEFYSQYYKFPLYVDQNKSLYEALGDRKMSMSINPFSWYSFITSTRKRFKGKNISGNMKGEGVLQGGVVLFGKKGVPYWAYQEKTGDEIPIEDLLKAVSDMKSGICEQK